MSKDLFRSRKGRRAIYFFPPPCHRSSNMHITDIQLLTRAISSQITGNAILCKTACLDYQHRNHQCTAVPTHRKGNPPAVEFPSQGASDSEIAPVTSWRVKLLFSVSSTCWLYCRNEISYIAHYLLKCFQIHMQPNQKKTPFPRPHF